MTTLTRDELREQRRSRKLALIDFVTALGYDATRLRSLSAKDGVITLNLFVDNDDETPHYVSSPEGTNRAQIELGLLFNENDLDADEEAGEAAKGLAAFLSGEPVQEDAFGNPKPLE